MTSPCLFGLQHSNRDFSSKKSWGKNQFNSSFPASLCCFLDNIGEKANYLSIHKEIFSCQEISISEVFGMPLWDKDLFFAFEAQHSPYQQYVVGSLPRTDLVIQRRSTGQCLRGLEVKLTALPDQTTCDLSDSEYGSEIVIRPDSIVYLACSVANAIGNTLGDVIPNLAINDWSEPEAVLPFIEKMIATLDIISLKLGNRQTPFLLQPIWKTVGKSPCLATNCLDVFFWSDAGFIYFITQIAKTHSANNKITRQMRTVVWLYKMLLDISIHGHFNHENIIDSLSYNTKNDKAFASSGNITNHFMRCGRLEKPVITKSQIKEIILGGGQHLLSPERRFDAIIYNSPELF